MSIETVFAILNFLVFVGVMSFVLIKSVFPGFAQELTALITQRLTWRQDSQQLSTQLQALTQKSIVQEQTYRTLEQKVAAWRQHLEQKQADQNQRSCSLNVSIHDRRQRQCAIFDAHKLSARVLPHALAEAQLELYTYYQTDQHGIDYINELVAALEKRP
jgi:hypothetical protein